LRGGECAMDDDELARLSRMARAGDIDARNRIVEANMGLVHHVVARCLRSSQAFRRSVADREDLVQEGAVGLLRAVEVWDPDRGTRFVSYASVAIRQRVSLAMIESYPVISAVHPAKYAARWRRLARRGLDESAIIRELKLTPGRVECVKDVLALQSREFGPPDVDCTAPDPSPLESAIAAEDDARDGEGHPGRAVRGAVHALPPRQRAAVEMFFGLDGGASLSYGDIADSLGISRSGAGQLVRRAVKCLAAALAG